MADFAALPLFTDAITADCHHLKDDEYGRYVRLLTLIWRSPKCRIPNDPEWIARKMARDWSLIEPLIKEFCQSDGNWITQKRLKKEFRYVAKRSKKQSANAKARWNKEKEECHGIASGGNAPTPTPTPTLNKSDKSLRVRKGRKAAQPEDAKRNSVIWALQRGIAFPSVTDRYVQALVDDGSVTIEQARQSGFVVTAP